MAITIGQRNRTTIGYQGTTGGRLSWVNQAGVEGRGKAGLGNTLMSVASGIEKIFDDELDASEEAQQYQQLQTNWNTQKNYWIKIFKDGGSNLDAQGIPTEILNPNQYINFLEGLRSQWDKDYIDGKNYPPAVLDRFLAWQSADFGALYENVDNWGRQRRVAKLISQDTITLQGIENTIINDHTVEGKVAAFDIYVAMYETTNDGGAPWRDLPQMAVTRKKLEVMLEYYSTLERALGQEGKNRNPNDLVSGYNSTEYQQAKDYIYNDKNLSKGNREKLEKYFGDLYSLRVDVENTEKLKAEAKKEDYASNLLAEDLLTPDIINALFTDEGSIKYWFGELYGKRGQSWLSDFERILELIQSGTFKTPNDISRDIYEVIKLIRTEAKNRGIPSPEVTKLIAAVNLAYSDSELTAMKKFVTNYARVIFIGDTDMLAGFGWVEGLPINKQAASVDRKLYDFINILNKRLDQGWNLGLTWYQMLDYEDDNYIVDTIINQVNGVLNESGNVTGGDVLEKEESGWFPKDTTFEQVMPMLSSIVDWVVGGQTVDSAKAITYNIYNESQAYQAGTTPEQAKFIMDTRLAGYIGEIPKQLTFPKEHPGYKQWPFGREPISVYEERIKYIQSLNRKILLDVPAS